MATLLSVITLVLTGQPLTPINVFTLMAFIGVLRLSTCGMLAMGLLATCDVYASLGRIEEFLLLEILPAILCDPSREDKRNTERCLPKFSNHQDKLQRVSMVDELKSTALCVSNLSYQQIGRTDEFLLRDIEFDTPAQSLTVITGPVGSGKSTLLSAIAGEISHTSGTVTCQGTLVYLPQTAWVFSGTIKENILFGQPYDETKYARIIKACALTEDIRHFPDRDQTVVGERGEVLSGGQQARVSLARAVYADGDVYLLDDPLSAVDLKVGHHIFDQCIKGLLGNKTRLLTSHHEQHMKEADKVIVLFKGRVLENDNFTNLEERGVLNTAIDPLYKKALKDDETDNSFVWEDEEKREVDRGYDEIVSLPNEAKSLQVLQEDRMIGVISSKLYWNYFKSGMHSSVIFVMIGFCLLTQGKPRCLSRN